MQAKIGIIGIGAIGSVIAKALIKSNQNNIKYYSRSPKTAIQVQYNSKKESFPIQCEPKISTNEKLDWLIICLKAYHFQDASSLFKSLIGQGTKVAIIRNGINLRADLEPYTSSNLILPCMIDCSVQPIDDGYYWQLNNPFITAPKSALASEFANLFYPKEILINQADDFKTENWKKLIESASLGAIQCLIGQTCHIFQDEKIINLFKTLVSEGIIVAKSDGAQIPIDFEENLLIKIKQYPSDKGSSMLTDRMLGNKIELEAKNGAISKIGKYYNIETPLNDLLCVMIDKINKDN